MYYPYIDTNFANLSLRKKLTFRSAISTLNFVFTILGYSLITGIISSVLPENITSSTSITIPLRCCFLMIAVVAFFCGKTTNLKFDWLMYVFVLFTVMYLIRTSVDLILQSPNSFDPLLAWRIQSYNLKFQTWSYILLITLFPIISIYRSWEDIDFQRALDIILGLGALACIAALRNVFLKNGELIGSDIESRSDANALLNTISFGHLGATIFLLSVYRFIFSPKTSFWKICSIFLMLLGIFVVLRAGSRGPFVAAFIGLLILLTALWRRFFLVGSFSILLLGMSYFFINPILNIVGKFSPVLAQRLENTLLYGEGSGREYILIQYLNETFKHPFLGFQLDLLGYSHNAILDAFMMFGWGAGWIVVILLFATFWRSLNLMMKKIQIGWVGLLYIQAFLSVQFSGCIGGNAFLQGTLIVILLFYMKYKKMIKTIY